MEDLYAYAQISRQAIQQSVAREQAFAAKEPQIIAQVQEIRQQHPRMGARKVYFKLLHDPSHAELLDGLGRDKFEAMLRQAGLTVGPLRNYRRTTQSGSQRFENLVEGMEVSDINRVWMSDITYFDLSTRFAYLTLIMDVYQRRCLACQPSLVMTAEQTVIPALQQAICTVGKKSFEGLIFHSDAGGQYHDKVFLKHLKDYGMIPSNSLDCYENPFIERLHSTIKNDYLYPWGVNSFAQLEKWVPKLLHLYNFERPHDSLNKRTPMHYQKDCHQLEEADRPILTIKMVQRLDKQGR